MSELNLNSEEIPQVAPWQFNQNHLAYRTCLAILVGVAFYLAAKFGLALSFKPDKISVFWPPNSIMLTALLLTPSRYWWSYFLAMAPAYFLASYEFDYLVPRAMIFFVANCLEILIPALIIKKFYPSSIQFKKIKEVWIFVLVIVIFAPIVSASIASLSAFIEEIQWWLSWRVWFLGDSLGLLVIVPFMLTIAIGIQNNFKEIPKRNYLEVMGLTILLIAISLFAFGSKIGTSGNIPVLVYLPLPVILWAAIRFGPIGTNSCTLLVSIISIWNASNGKGPFTTLNSADNVLSLQFFLMVLLTSMLFLTAFIQEHKILLKESEAQKKDLERLAEERKLNEERLRFVEGLAYDIIWEWNIAEGSLKWFGDIDKYLGYGKNEFPRTIEAWESILHPEDRDRVLKSLQQHQDGNVEWHEEYRVIKKDGSIIWWEDYGETRWNENSKPKIMNGTIKDITEKKESEEKLKSVLNELAIHKKDLEKLVEERTEELTRSQERLHHADKLSSLGKLTGSIAHEFNNPIYAIRLILEQLNEEITHTKESGKGLEIAISECKRISNLIAKLKDFYLPTSGNLKSIFINELLNDVLTLLKGPFEKNNIELIKDYDMNFKTVYVVEDQIKQVFLNIFQNAVESFSSDSKKKTIRINISFSKSEIKISIQDNGSGICQENILTIFEPFVSTKVTKKGSGLGLSISYRIIEDHGGKIEVESEINKGSIFAITLPVEAEK